MEITAALAEQLRILCGDPDRGDRLATGFTHLAHQVARAVPSCLSVSITLGRPGADLNLTVPIRPAFSVPVLASLAVPLSAGEPGDVLILRAGDAGAFLLLADDLGALLDAGHPPLAVDGHLQWPAAVTGASLAASLDDLRAVNQAIGVLIERGWEPAAAQEELHRRAREANIAVGAAGRLVLKWLNAPDGS